MDEAEQLKEIVRVQGERIEKLEQFLMYLSKIDVFRQNRDIESLQKLIGARLEVRGRVDLATGADDSWVNIGTGTAQHDISIGNDNVGTKLGFFGVAPVVQQNAIADLNVGTATVSDVATTVNQLLGRQRNYGLIKP